MRPIDFGGLFERYWPDVFRFALYLTGNRADAEDVASETFARAWTAPGEIRVGTVKAYLFMIARNLSIDLRRAARAEVECDPDAAATGAGPEQVAIDRAELRAVLVNLAELPEPDRAALLMRAVGQLSYEETAAALGLSVGAARVRVHRARARLAAASSRGRTQP
jgi:RNA polymerase sigma-70 factor (ECF subfamily)